MSTVITNTARQRFTKAGLIGAGSGSWVLDALCRDGRSQDIVIGLEALAAAWFDEYSDETELPAELIQFYEWADRHCLLSISSELIEGDDDE